MLLLQLLITKLLITKRLHVVQLLVQLHVHDHELVGLQQDVLKRFGDAAQVECAVWLGRGRCSRGIR